MIGKKNSEKKITLKFTEMEIREIISACFDASRWADENNYTSIAESRKNIATDLFHKVEVVFK